MIERTTGLVLRTYPLTETSLIVHWLTRDAGRLGTVAKGARRPKSPFRGKLDLFYLCEFTFQRSRRSELHILREVSLLDTHEVLRRELAYLQQAAYATRLIEQVTETQTPVPGLFELLAGFLAHLPLQPPRPQPVLVFELKLLRELGLQPDWANIKFSAATATLLRQLTEVDWPALPALSFSQEQLTEIHQFLHGFLVFHLGKIVRGRSEALVSVGE
jgi:DNA repair protein RecO (recombination protein O)